MKRKHKDISPKFRPLTGKITDIISKSRGLALIFENSPVMTMITDKNARIEYINPAMSRFTGVSQKKAQKMMCGELILCGQHTNTTLGCGTGTLCKSCKIRAIIERTHRYKNPFLKTDAVFHPIKGWPRRLRHLIVSTALIKTPSGTKVLVALEDVTAIKEAENSLKKTNSRLKELNTVRKNFICMISHELKTPLTLLNGYLFLLKKEISAGLSGPAAQYLLDLEKNSARLEFLISDLIDISRIETGTLRIVKKPFSIRGLIFEAAHDYEALQSKDSAEIIPDFREGPVEINADPERIRQVLMIVLNNAVKFSKPGGKIYLDAGIYPAGSLPYKAEKKYALSDLYCYIRVRDEGIGIEPVMLGKIFKEFFQVGSTLTRSQGGMGLGLKIASHIISAHGGIIAAESSGVNNGATFHIVLPAESKGVSYEKN